MKTTIKRVALSLTCAGMLALYGCGGGGGSGAAVSAGTTISGTAAAGLPLVGTVTVKDAAGATRTTAIGTNGAYSIDVSGLTAPFVFRAEGTVGGRSYVIHSAASAADATGGTINITPLTDLIVSNIAGQVAANYFNSGNFSALTRAELDAETASLKAKLLPVLTAMGVESTIDLLRTAFTPLSSALDKALDVIRVSVDTTTNVATITNLVNQQQIVDNLATKAAAETTAPPLSGTGMATAADDLVLIRKALTDFSAQLAAGLPSPASLLPLMHDTTALPFRDADLNATQFANEVATNELLIGVTFTDVVIRRINYEASDGFPIATVDFNLSKGGVVVDRAMSMQVARNTDGVWRIRGDGRVLDTYSQAHIVKNATSGCVSTGMEFGFNDPNTANSAGIRYMRVTGPGLPAGGLRYLRSDIGDNWTIANVAGQTGRYYVWSTNCVGATHAGLSDATIAAIADDSVYTLAAYDAADVPFQRGGVAVVYTDRIARRALTLAEAAAASFPTITAPTASAFSIYNGGALTISATGINPSGGWVYLGLTDTGGVTTSISGDVPTGAGGTISETVGITPSGTVRFRELRVETSDAFWRKMMTVLSNTSNVN